MDNETSKVTPILNIAWTRFAHLDNAATRRTKSFFQIRRWIIWLGVLATLLAIVTQTFFANSESLLGLIIKIFFVITPAVASGIAAFATKFYSNGSWLIYRAGAEEILKEIYLYRTILNKTPSRRAYLEKRLAEIQRQIYQSLSGEFAFEPYDGPIPPHYNSQDEGSDPGFTDLTGEQYFRFRLESQLSWHNSRVNKYKAERRRMTIFILAAGVTGTVFATGIGGLGIWVALTASITAALIGWQELRDIDTRIRNFSKVVMELTILYDHWQNLEPKERTTAEFYKVVQGCEGVLWAQNVEYIKSMQEALKESNLDEEASLINRVIKESVDSAKRTQQEMRDAVVDVTRKSLEDAEQKVVEEFKETLGSLSEEASSELVQQELEAMGKAVSDMAQAAMARISALTSSLAEIAEDFAHVDIGRDTNPAELNQILSRYPKTSEVKG